MKPARRHHGFTLTGTMVGVALGMTAMLAAFATWQVMRDAYASVADSIELEERGQRALAIVAHAVRQAGWVPAQVALAAAHPAPVAPMEGRDDCGAPYIDGTLHCGRSGFRGSDALLVRFSGSGRVVDPTMADGTMTDCSGYPLPAKAVVATDALPPHHAATNLFYIGTGSDGVPQLLCRYPRRVGSRVQSTTYTSGTLVRGVESMQLRFGMDNDGGVEFLDEQAAAAQQDDAIWHRVNVVQITLVLRGQRPTTDRETRRRVFATTVRLRNPSPCRVATC
ncbi:PilW family protein [Cupriavidus sp. BIS7]|uniref:PilW family protein n=1 Tax=Cupriavidus sp. BIS7 TaxID=1217718 RepID=UPI000474D54D|nr:PilW family protein [Cupriavidus sp. BIS7]